MRHVIGTVLLFSFSALAGTTFVTGTVSAKESGAWSMLQAGSWSVSLLGGTAYVGRFRLTDGALNLSLMDQAPAFDTGQVAVPVRVVSSLKVPITSAQLPELMSAPPGSDTGQASVPVRIISSLGAAGGGLTDSQLRATAVPVSLASAPTTAVTNAGLSNIDVALSTRTKPADQQHTIIDSSASIAVTGPLTDAALRATPVPVSGTVTASGPVTDTQLRATPVPVSGTVTATTGGLTDTQLRNSAVPVSLASMPSTPVTGAFFQATQPISGTTTVQGQDSTGTAHTIATDSYGVVSVYRVNALPPLNPFLPRCNPVRRFNCQP